MPTELNPNDPYDRDHLRDPIRSNIDNPRSPAQIDDDLQVDPELAEGLNAPPLLSRQAVQVLGRNQHFCTRRARETLGWEPRVDYEAGLEATVEWLKSEYLQAR